MRKQPLEDISYRNKPEFKVYSFDIFRKRVAKVVSN